MRTQKPLKMKDVIRAALPVTYAFTDPLEGIQIWTIGTEEELLRSGAVKVGEFPGPRRGSCRQLSEVRVGRNADGRCNVRVWGIRAARLDLGFQDFMKGLLADRQCSLVSLKKPGAA